MSEKTEWPTPAKLEELREQGFLPYSRLATAAAVTIVLVLVAASMHTQWRLWLTSYLEAVREFQGPIAGNTWAKLIHDSDTILPLIIFPPLIAAVSALAIGLLQTRFYFAISSLSLNFDRLNPSIRLARASPAKKFAAALLVAMLGLGIGILSGYLLAGALFAALNHDRRYLLQLPVVVGRTAIPIVIAFLAAIGIFSWLRARFAFMLAHRMTRHEFEQSQRG